MPTAVSQCGFQSQVPHPASAEPARTDRLIDGNHRKIQKTDRDCS